MSKNYRLKDFWTSAQRDAMGSLPTWHCYCEEKTGVSRPGKTRRDRAKKFGTDTAVGRR